MIALHDTLSAELREVEQQHPGWHTTVDRKGWVLALLSSIRLDAPTPQRLDEAIAVWEHTHRKAAMSLQDGDVIRIRLHEHDPVFGSCPVGCRECDVEVCGCPRPAGEYVAVDWDADGITGTVVYEPGRMVLCIEHAGGAAA